MSNEGGSVSSFAEFFEGWEVRNRSYLEKLLAVEDDAEEDSLRHLVEQVLTHCQEYYDEKSKAAESDVFLMFSPPWFTSFERALLWVTGLKPSMAFKFVRESIGDDLSEEQREKLAAVKEETRRTEREIEQAMARMQESVAAPPIYELVKRETSLVDGQVSDLAHVVGDLKSAMPGVMRDADLLRQNSAGEVLAVLTPAQKVKFLAATGQFWVQARRLGMERDRQRI